MDRIDCRGFLECAARSADAPCYSRRARGSEVTFWSARLAPEVRGAGARDATVSRPRASRSVPSTSPGITPSFRPAIGLQSREAG